MITIQSVMLICHVLISAAIIGLVLLQRGKGADAGAAFGAGASGTVFGARGSANFLSRTTAVLAAAFFFSSLGLAYLGSRQVPVESLMDLTAPAGQETPSMLPLDEPGGLDDLPSPPALGEPAGQAEEAAGQVDEAAGGEDQP